MPSVITEESGLHVNAKLWLTFWPIVLIAAGCEDSTHSQYRDRQTEERIKSFYATGRERLEISSVTGDSAIDAYCVLVPYQNDLDDKDNLVVPANGFLKQIELQPDEDYWHIVVRSAGRFILLRMAQPSTPLLTPASYLKNSCVVGTTLVIKKSTTRHNKLQTMKIGD